MCASSFNTIVKSSQNVSIQLTSFYITYTNNDQKMLVRAKKTEISLDKFKELASIVSQKVFQEKRERKKKVIIYI